MDQRVVITDVDIAFGKLVLMFIKFGLAAIPAAIVVSIIMSVVMVLLAGIFGGAGMMTGMMN